MTRLINVTYYVEMNICRWYDYNKHLAMYFVFFLKAAGKCSCYCQYQYY